MISIGIDPGTDSASPTGFAAIDTRTKELLWFSFVGSRYSKLEHRIKEISDLVEKTLSQLDDELTSSRPVIVCIEDFYMRGIGGRTLQRLIGSIMGRVPYKFQVRFINNLTMKKMVTGSGKATKREVAEGVREWFSDNPVTHEIVEELASSEDWDVTDALGLAITGFKKEIRWKELKGEDQDGQ